MTSKIIYRLMQDWKGLFEGSCISEEKYKGVWYLDKALYEPVTEEGIEDWIKVPEENYCEANGLECILCYTENEVKEFLSKLIYARNLN